MPSTSTKRKPANNKPTQQSKSKSRKSPAPVQANRKTASESRAGTSTALSLKELKVQLQNMQGKLDAIDRVQAVIEFKLDGTIVTANQNFLNCTGYRLDEIQGQHHRIFVDKAYAESSDYRLFWQKLGAGQVDAGEYQRFGKTGESIWISASYNPIFDVQGEVVGVVKFATDITDRKKLEEQLAEKQRLDAAASQELQRKVSEILSGVSLLAKGDFTVEFPDLGTDSIGQVSRALGDAVAKTRETLIEFSQVAETVSTAAEQLTSASREISSGAQTQASSLEETASSLEEITSTVKQNTDNAQQARQLAVGSRDVAEKGGSVVGEAVAAMADINQSSKKIADIITTIDEIAFQTNLLALNAAVEAARAGEQGRGFAVVAAEVRNLAQRSASAAREIKSLIEDSVTRITNGTVLVNKSGETLNEIVNSVKRVTDIVAEIAAASKEQLVGIEQVNKAVTQMDRVTQANAAQTEEVSGTAASLLSHAEQLSEGLNRFKLDVNQLNKNKPLHQGVPADAGTPIRQQCTTEHVRSERYKPDSVNATGASPYHEVDRFDFGTNSTGSSTLLEF